MTPSRLLPKQESFVPGRDGSGEGKWNCTAISPPLLPQDRGEGETKVKLTLPKEPPGFSQMQVSHGNTLSPAPTPQKHKFKTSQRTALSHMHEASQAPAGCTGKKPGLLRAAPAQRAPAALPALLTPSTALLPKESAARRGFPPQEQAKTPKATTKKTHTSVRNVPLQHPSPPGKR